MVNFAFANFLVITTIGFAQVNSATLLLFPIVRQLAIIFCAIAVIFITFKNKKNIETIICIFMLITLYSVSILTSRQIFWDEFGIQGILISFVLVLVGAVLLTLKEVRYQSKFIATFFIIYSTISLIYITITGGFSLFPSPKFYYDMETENGALLLYNHGTTKFFGISAIFLLFIILEKKISVSRIFSVTFFCFMFFLSFLGGGRGDFLALIFVCFVMVCFSGIKNAAYYIATISFIFVLIIYMFPYLLEDTTAFIRYDALLQNDIYGKRDILFFDAINLIKNEPICLISGCGLGFFQEYYNYPYALYPHNIFIEAFIAWGSILFLPIVFLFIVGLSEARNSLGVFLWIGFYFIGIGLKSGDVATSWFAMSFVVYVAAVGARMIFFRPDAKQKMMA